MVSQIQTTAEIIYPDCDGQPMSDNTKQFRWIVLIQQNLESLFSHDPNVFVAGDLLWYPVKDNNKIRNAPDAMVVFGRPKGDRGSYMQWKEDNIAPQVVFEVLSPGNNQTEMNKKLLFYERYGVEEYYLYDPYKNDLSGWVQKGDRLDVIDSISTWISPRLGISFDFSDIELKILRPDGTCFTTLDAERQRAERLAAKLQELGIDPSKV
jgi:Uma2 family endonuclease